jgi:hypothetical protein
MATCTVCGSPVVGHPDDDLCCAWCDQANFAAVLAFRPARSFLQVARGDAGGRRDGIRAIGALREEAP